MDVALKYFFLVFQTGEQKIGVDFFVAASNTPEETLVGLDETFIDVH